MNITQKEIANLAHTLNGLKSVQQVIKNLVEKALEINKNNEVRIKEYGQRLDRLAAEQPKEDHHKPAPGGW